MTKGSHDIHATKEGKYEFQFVSNDIGCDEPEPKPKKKKLCLNRVAATCLLPRSIKKKTLPKLACT